MIYIYEGVDLAGKSTLAKEFSAYRKIPTIKKKLEVFKHTKKEWLRGAEVELVTEMFFESIFPLAKYYDFVLDRGLLSSLVYSRYFNRKVTLDYIQKYFIGPEAEYVKVKLIIANEESLKRRFKTRGERLFTLEELLTIQSLYAETARTLIGSAAKNLEIIQNNDND